MRNAAFLAVVACALPAGYATAQQVHVLPYVQPGDGSSLTGTDTKVICWLTDQTPGDFTVEYSGPGAAKGTVKPLRVTLDFPPYKPKPLPVAPPPHEVLGPPKRTEPDDADHKEPKVPLPPETEQKFFLYTATLTDLPFNATITYRVKLGHTTVREASVRTRATADKAVRCVLVGDLAQGREAQKAIAYRIDLEKPEFLVALGDIVYPTGRVNQYTAFFWNTYNNVPVPSLRTGAPLMASVPFYALLGNHDIAARPGVVPDALAAYYFFHVPKNGPGDGPWATPLGLKVGTAEKAFRANTQGNYPALDAYSFDYGPAHFTVINDNARIAITDPAFTKWLRGDLTGTRAHWKFVCYHVPGFHASKQHYTEQQARQLHPLFEECGVDATFAGHVHNYQRSVPLTFRPDGAAPVRGKVNGAFTLDTDFDGRTNTVPRGIIHFVAGGGGASLYGPAPEKVAADLKKLHGDNLAPYTAKATADKHTFVVLDLAPDTFELRALAADGSEVDKITVTKKK